MGHGRATVCSGDAAWMAGVALKIVFEEAHFGWFVKRVGNTVVVVMTSIATVLRALSSDLSDEVVADNDIVHLETVRHSKEQ